jgi:hypothetical protein
VAEISDLEIVDASNTARFPEGMLGSAINNGARALEGLLARWYEDTDGSLTSGGSSNAYTLTSKRTIAALTNNTIMVFTSNFANTGAATLALNGLTAKAIRRPNGDALEANDIVSGQAVIVIYKSSPDYWQLLSPYSGQIPSINVPARAYAETSTPITAGSAIPDDGTVPLVSEGDQALTADITLKRATSRVRLIFDGSVSHNEHASGNTNAQVAAFRGSTCLMAKQLINNDGGNPQTRSISLMVEDAPGSVGPHTYSVRVGDDGGTVTFLGDQSFGGTEKLTLALEEIFT